MHIDNTLEIEGREQKKREGERENRRHIHSGQWYVVERTKNRQVNEMYTCLSTMWRSGI